MCFDLSKFESTFNTAKYWIQQLELNNSSDSREKIEIRLVGQTGFSVNNRRRH